MRWNGTLAKMGLRAGAAILLLMARAGGASPRDEGSKFRIRVDGVVVGRAPIVAGGPLAPQVVGCTVVVRASGGDGDFPISYRAAGPLPAACSGPPAGAPVTAKARLLPYACIDDQCFAALSLAGSSLEARS